MTKIESYKNRLIHVLLVLQVWLVLKTTPVHQVQGNIVFCNQKNNFQKFLRITYFIDTCCSVWFDSKTYNMTQYGTENFSKVAFINLYNCLYLIANTLRLVILPNLFKTAFALDNAKRNNCFTFCLIFQYGWKSFS